jgi:hypothetical protein
LGKLFKFTFTETLASGTAPKIYTVASLGSGSIGIDGVDSAAGANSFYGTLTATTTGIFQFSNPNAVAAEYTIADLAVKSVTGATTSGANINSAKGASDRNWKVNTSGFTLNATSYFIIVRLLR